MGTQLREGATRKGPPEKQQTSPRRSQRGGSARGDVDLVERFAKTFISTNKVRPRVSIQPWHRGVVSGELLDWLPVGAAGQAVPKAMGEEPGSTQLPGGESRHAKGWLLPGPREGRGCPAAWAAKTRQALA